MNNTVYITLDYELFLGSNTGTVQNCLLTPGHYLLEVLDKHNIKATFFVDAAYLFKLRELSKSWPSLNEDYHAIINHVSLLSQQGHSIQLHFHPQWLYSKYDGGWSMDSDHYKIDDMGQVDINEILPQAIELLNSIISKPVSAFRAGGYTLKNFALVKHIFAKYGVKCDSSVLRDCSMHSDFQQYDYRKCPSLGSYTFENSFVNNINSGSFVEYPISTMKVNCITSFADRFRYKNAVKIKDNKAWGDGKSVSPFKTRTPIIKKLLLLLKSSYRVASIDGIKSAWLESIFNYNKTLYNEFVVIGHPKLITPFSLNNLEAFIVKYEKELKFSTL